MNVLINKMGDVIMRGGFSGLTDLFTCVYLAKNMGKGFLKILIEELPSTSSLYQIFNKNNVKLRYS